MSDETKPASEPEPEGASAEGAERPSSEPASSPAPEAPPAGPAAQQPNYAFLAAVSILSLVADLGTKWWAKAHLEMPLDDTRLLTPKRVDLIKGYVALVFARNKGGAWGLLQDENEAVRRPFFLLISAAAIVFIVSLYRKLTPGQTALKWGLPLVLGGALGNLVDRIRYGHVVDFIDVYLVQGGKEHHWPTFNVADIAICVGVGLMAVDMFTSRKSKSVSPPSSTSKTPDTPGSDPDPPSSKSDAPIGAKSDAPIGAKSDAPIGAKPAAPIGAKPADPTPAPPAEGA